MINTIFTKFLIQNERETQICQELVISQHIMISTKVLINFYSIRSKFIAITLVAFSSRNFSRFSFIQSVIIRCLSFQIRIDQYQVKISANPQQMKIIFRKTVSLRLNWMFIMIWEMIQWKLLLNEIEELEPT